MTIPELLMPAGNFEKLKTAFRYGADACYIGMPNFSLRYRENQTTKNDLKKAVQYTRKIGKKIYITLNTFPHNNSIQKIISHIKYLKTIKPDAIIFSDPGVFKLIKKYYPKVELHLSVQSTCTNYETVKFWRDHGVKRIILARELSIKEILEIHKKVPDIELECFVHGAICMAYSGRCLISNYLTGRDANQGDCSHPCRWNYQIKTNDSRHSERLVPRSFNEVGSEESNSNTRFFTNTQDDIANYFLEEALRPGEYFPIYQNDHGSHILSSRDLCLIAHLKKLQNAGVISFKIEGRAKNINYVATIAKAYRKAIDDMVTKKSFDEKVFQEVSSVSNRGFFSGFYFKKPSAKDHQLDANRTQGTYEFIGVVKSYDKKNKFATIQCKSQIKLNDNIEILTPKNLYMHNVKNLLDHNKNPIKIFHPGTKHNFLLKIDDPISKGNILRKKIKKTD